jgi:isopentenyl-diphosphate delta-isomerase
LHRAFSVFIFNSKREMLLQKRSKNKYHSGGLWTNACCSHPRPGEPLEKAAHRRLKEEIGFDCELKKIFFFRYSVHFDNELNENEIDHVFVGKCDKKPQPNLNEVEDWKYVPINELRKDIAKNPEYTYWFLHSLEKVLQSSVHGK